MIQTLVMANAMTLFLILAMLAFNAVSARNQFSGKQSPATIKMSNGQVYNCVDFYEQPAFRHPSLNIQVVRNLSIIQQQKSTTGLGLEGPGCPIGTVPILNGVYPNVRDEFPPIIPPPQEQQPKIHCYAVVQTKPNDPNKKFFGGNAGIAIYNPEVKSSQWSTARIKLMNGGDSIQAGWMVNPDQFKDNESHLYASFSAGGKGCTNTDRPGFVQVSTDVPLGVAANEYSVIGGQQVYWNISIDKHQDDGHWWVSLGKDKHKIGYFPKNLFTTLGDMANQVEFGGEINNPGPTFPPPSMGNSALAHDDPKYSSCFYHSTVVDQSFSNVNPPDTQLFIDCPGLYTALDGGYHDDPDLGRLIFYGGPKPNV